MVNCRPVEDKNLLIKSTFEKSSNSSSRSKREAERKRVYRRKSIDKMSDAEFYSYVQLRAMMGWTLFHINKTIFLYLFRSKFHVIFLPPNDDVLMLWTVTKENISWIIHEFKRQKNIFSFFSRCHFARFPFRNVVSKPKNIFARRLRCHKCWYLHFRYLSHCTMLGSLHSIFFGVILLRPT